MEPEEKVKEQTELFDACEFGDLESVCDMMSRGADPNRPDSEKGETALHWAARYGQVNIVKHLVENNICEVNRASKDGSTPLYLACRENRVSVVEYLIKNPDVFPSMRDYTGQTPIHWASRKGELGVVRILIEDRQVNPNSKDNSGQTPLHLACRWGHQAVVEYLVKCPNVDSNMSDSSGLTPLYKACSCGHREIAECLLKGVHIDVNTVESNGWTPLHWACEWGFLDIVETLIKKHNADPNRKDSKGMTPVHWACRCRYGRNAMLTYLAGQGNANFDYIANDGQTVFDIIQSSDGIRLLLMLGATPNFNLDEQFFPSYLRQDEDDTSMKMFVIGSTGSGKSTLSKSLERERKGFARFKSRFVKVKGVNIQTAGIIPYDIIREAMGSITIFDFAGDKMFYAGHDALLSNAMANSPSIILLTVDLNEEEDKFRATLLYWLEFINNRCTNQNSCPHIVLIGSHADQSKDVPAKVQVMKSLADSPSYDGLTFAGQVTIDCRFAASASMTELISLLTQSCQTLRSHQKMPFEAHCFLRFLLMNYEGTPALMLGTAKEKLVETIKEEMYLTFFKSHDLFEICEQLNGRGHILFMKDHKNPLHSWIILNKAALLSQVFGTVFAPQGFKEHHRIANSAGIVPLSKIASILPNLNTAMVIQFLCHMRFCQEVLNHQRVPCLQIDADNSTDVSESERFFIFPGLIQLSAPTNLWQADSPKECKSGWSLQCSVPGQFLTPRFTQVQLLELFNIATSDLLEHPSKECNIWDSGIAWTSKSGVEVIVEIADRRTITVLTRCRRSEMLELVRLRSALIRNILETKNNICPKICTHESFIVPEHLTQYPLKLPDSGATVSMMDVAQAVVKGKTMVSVNNNGTMELERIFQFEPYAQLGEDVLQELFKKEIQRELTDDFLRTVVERVHHNVAPFKVVMTLLSNSHQAIQAEGGDSGELLRMLQVWRDEILQERTTNGSLDLFSELRAKWDQYSIFAGRNVINFPSVV